MKHEYTTDHGQLFLINAKTQKINVKYKFENFDYMMCGTIADDLKCILFFVLLEVPLSF